jgi:hypothetical protein
VGRAHASNLAGVSFPSPGRWLNIRDTPRAPLGHQPIIDVLAIEPNLCDEAPVFALPVLDGLHDQRLVEDQTSQEVAGREAGLLFGTTDLRRIDSGQPEPLAADPDREAEIKLDRKPARRRSAADRRKPCRSNPSTEPLFPHRPSPRLPSGHDIRQTCPQTMAFLYFLLRGFMLRTNVPTNGHLLSSPLKPPTVTATKPAGLKTIKGNQDAKWR